MSTTMNSDEQPVDPLVLERVAKYADVALLDKNHFIRRVEEGRTGAYTGIDNGMPQLSQHIYGTHRARYYLIGADSSVGKTTIADFMYVLRAWAWCKANGRKLYLYYYSFEISMEMKKARWVSFYIHYVFGIDMPSDYILGMIPGRMVTDAHMDMIRRAYVFVDDIFADIIFVEDPVHPTRMFHAMVEGHYEKHGTVLRHKASDPKKKGTIYGWTPNPGEETAIVMIMCDTLQLMMTEQGFDIKQSMDLWSKYSIFLRNMFGATMVYIQQFNTDLTASYRDMKKGQVPKPMRIDFGDSRYTFRDADVVLGLVKPYQYDVTEFARYDITKLRGYMLMLYLMKNRYGNSDRKIPIFLDPIAGTVEDLPLTPDIPFAMEPYYSKANQLDKVCQSFSPQNPLPPQGFLPKS